MTPAKLFEETQRLREEILENEYRISELTRERDGLKEALALAQKRIEVQSEMLRGRKTEGICDRFVEKERGE